MAKWQREHLGNHAQIRARIGWRGLSSDEYVDSGPFLIAGKHIISGSIDWDSCDHLTEHRYQESLEIALESGDVIVSKDGTIGRVARIDYLPGPATLNGTMMLVRPTRSLDYRYLAHVLNGQEFQNLVDERISGSSIPHLFQRDLVTLPISIPRLEEQRRIADVLDSIDESIQATERLIAKHEKFCDGLAPDLLWNSHLDRDLVPINDIGQIIGGGTPSRERIEYWNGSIPWLTPSELSKSRNKYVLETKESISESGMSGSAATVLPEGSLLMTSRASIGFCALAGMPMATNQGFQNVVPHGDIDSSYLLHLGRSLRREMIRRASGTTFLEITGREFGRISVPHPPLHEQRRIASILDTADEAIHRHEDELAKLRKLRSGLATDLLSGRVSTVAV